MYRIHLSRFHVSFEQLDKSPSMYFFMNKPKMFTMICVFALQAAEQMVKFQLRHGNDLLAMDALKDCDVNLQEQGSLLRQDEFLVWQGRKKSLRHVFLFEDMILFSKTKRNRHGGPEYYVYKNSFKVSLL